MDDGTHALFKNVLEEQKVLKIIIQII
jgi:hypothetical protein